MRLVPIVTGLTQLVVDFIVHKLVPVAAESRRFQATSAGWAVGRGSARFTCGRSGFLRDLSRSIAAPERFRGARFPLKIMQNNSFRLVSIIEFLGVALFAGGRSSILTARRSGGTCCGRECIAASRPTHVWVGVCVSPAVCPSDVGYRHCPSRRLSLSASVWHRHRAQWSTACVSGWIKTIIAAACAHHALVISD